VQWLGLGDKPVVLALGKSHDGGAKGIRDSGKARGSLSGALGKHIDLAAFFGQQSKPAVGFAGVSSAQNDGRDSTFSHGPRST
jgi:hypothetical protein